MGYDFYCETYKQSYSWKQLVFYVSYLGWILQYFYKYNLYQSSIQLKILESLNWFEPVLSFF